MEELLKQCFTHIDDLKKLEPDYFKPNIEEMTLEKAEPMPKNPVMILEEGVKRIYGEAPKHNLLRNEGSLSVPEFVMQCQVRRLTTEGKGKTKKLAKQIACAEMLKLILKSNLQYAKDFGVPQTSYEAAEAYLNQLAEKVSEPSPAPEDNDADFDRATNYVGMVQEICKKYNISSQIEYVDRSEGTPVDMKFFVTCKIGEMKTEGEGRKKKDAKTLAAYRMSKILKDGIDDLNKNFENLVLFDEDAENAAEFTGFPVRSPIDNPVKSMEEILADKSKFVSYETHYRELPKLSNFCLSQALLTVKFVLVGKTQEEMHVFPGVGDTYEEARKRAALNALLLLETF